MPHAWKASPRKTDVSTTTTCYAKDRAITIYCGNNMKQPFVSGCDWVFKRADISRLQGLDALP